ncbi:hypothetical protein G6O67_007860 [Ophiocordyceps sinensis]|uniref:Uncharacterized protein n=1 Tax=Ophiocordyceps sinensis TaxID=72228 RepID=A0A8H4LRQ5_9HYPO|nr:hypothetical protein G6O67_007860 [Ophiocordyceps sinensis]
MVNVRFDMATMSFCQPVDCSNLTSGKLEPYGDISGPGVIVSFVGSGYLIGITLIGYYLTAYDPQKAPAGQGAGLEHLAPFGPNPIDVKLLGWVRGGAASIMNFLPDRAKAVFRRDQTDLERAFHQAIVNICDVQILTGAGILISGFLSLKCGGHPVSAYHWQIVVSTAWFATVTHLAGLTAIRQHLREHRRKRNVRMAFMAATLVGLLVALVPTAYFNWYITATPWSPAMCYFSASVDTTSARLSNVGNDRSVYLAKGLPAFDSMVVSLVTIICGVVLRCSKIFGHASGAIRSCVRQPLSNFMQRFILWTMWRSRQWPNATAIRSKRHQACFYLVTRPAIAGFFTLRFFADLLGSMLFELYWVIASLWWGSLRLWAAQSKTHLELLKMWLDLQNLRKHGVSTISAALSQVRDEEQWTFGQVLAVLLLALPLLNLVETLALEVGGRRNPSVATSRASAEDTGLSMLQRQCGGLFPARLDRSCYTAVVGLGPCIVGVAGSALALTVHFGASVSNYTSPIARDSRESVFDFLW